MGITIGIMGNGVTGNALHEYFLGMEVCADIVLYDPPQGLEPPEIKDCDMIFICVPAKSEGTGQNLDRHL